LTPGGVYRRLPFISVGFFAAARFALVYSDTTRKVEQTVQVSSIEMTRNC
jgi:hypothetical protein